ncbi:RagB/SusD family nutrient uptake outer membrane protein [Dyadobacter chenwenxiniae]|nr:RagB/SusD family nutrient uptake outer membrane protein [Dyadobacter chenwenxiniae]
MVEVVAVNKTFDASRHYLWPIPQKERDLNPSLTQNPGW